MVRNATGCILWYRNVSKRYVPLYIGDSHLQIQNFSKKRLMFMELCKGVTVLQHPEETVSLKKQGTVFPFELCHPNGCRFSVTLFSSGKSKCWGCTGGVLCHVFCEMTIGDQHYEWQRVTCRKVVFLTSQGPQVMSWRRKF